MSETGLAVADLACRRGERLVFAGLSFALAPGEALLVTGPNGSGKSSLLRLLAGLAAPEAGAVRWNGAPADDDPEGFRTRLVYVGHQDAVKPALTVRENLAFWTMLQGGGEVEAALAGFGLAELADMPGRYLSAGQRRRAALARLLAVRAPLWLLDEPTLGLDAASQRALEAALARHLEQRGLAVVATHAPLKLPAAFELALDRYAAPAEAA